MEHQMIWVKDPKHAYLLARITGFNKAQICSQNSIFDNTLQTEGILGKEIETQQNPFYSTHLKGTPNLLELDQLTEEGILHNCRLRYFQDNIYTAIGETILISVNPFRVIDHQSGQATMKLYSPFIQHSNEAHIYKLGAMAIERQDLKKQVFLIQGESGSGKTKNCETLLKQIAYFCSEGKADQKILSSAPIMEAFGNAKTARNDNSSRFGKFLKISLNQTIVSAEYQTYLLEQSRVTTLSKTDKNYHIFYQILFALMPNSKVADFNYLNKGDLNLDQIQYKNEFKETLDCLKQQQFDQDTINSILEIIKGILYLGNLSFKDIGNDSTRIIEDDNLQQTLKYLSISADNLNSIICCTRAKTVKDAQSYRDSLAKFIYSNIFDEIVKSINMNLKTNEQQTNQIALLDIFGFESFEEHGIQQNSFEQLNINYANELLQQQFNKTIIYDLQTEYNEEGFACDIDFQANDPIINLIKEKIFPKLNDITSTDDSLMNVLDKLNSDSGIFTKIHLQKIQFKDSIRNVFNTDHSKTAHRWFAIKHSADYVVYTSDGFSDKNKNKILIGNAKSSNPLLQHIFSSPPASQTIAKLFTSQLTSLFNEIQTADRQFYVKCIKPNMQKKPQEFNGHESLRQLVYSGVLEAARIRKSAFEYKIPISQLNRLFLKVFIQKNKDQYKVGKTRIYYKKSLHDLYEREKNASKTRSVILIQRRIRVRLQKRNWSKAIDFIPKMRFQARLELIKRVLKFFDHNAKKEFLYQQIEKERLQKEQQKILQEKEQAIRNQQDNQVIQPETVVDLQQNTEPLQEIVTVNTRRQNQILTVNNEEQEDLIQKLQSQNYELQSNIARLENENETLRNLDALKALDILQFQMSAQSQANQIERMQDEIAFLKEQMSIKEQQYKGAKSSNQDPQIEILKEVYQESQNEQEYLKKMLTDETQRLQISQSQKEDFKKRSYDLEDQIHSLNLKCSQLELQLLQSQNAHKSFEQQLEQKKTIISNLIKNKDQLTENISTLNKQLLSKTLEEAFLKNQLDQIQLKYDDLARSETESARTILQLEKEIHQRDANLKTMESWRDDLVKYQETQLIIEDYLKLKDNEMEIYKKKVEKLELKLNFVSDKNLETIKQQLQEKWNLYKFKSYGLNSHSYELPKAQNQLINRQSIGYK